MSTNELNSFDVSKLSFSSSSLVPNTEFIMKHVDEKNKKYFNDSIIDNYIKTNTRTVLKVSLKESSEKLLTDFIKMRTSLFKYQYKLPMKYLKPAVDNRYVAQKSMLIEESNKIESAYKQIEPFNIGFDNYIQLIPINQDIELGTVYTINVTNDYNELTRKFFRSNSIKTNANLKSMGVKYDFCKNLHIGTIDIGSNYRGKFTVTYKPINSDCLCKYNFRIINDKEFEIIYYDFIFNFKQPEEVFKQLLLEVTEVM